MISNNTSTGQDCGGKLKYYDKVRRIVRTKGGKISKFFCPVCKKDRYITWSDLRKKTVYEGENTQ